MNIIILSKGPGNYSTKRLKEEAIKKGHNVRIVNYAECYVMVEQNKPVVRYRGEEITDVDAIIPRIAAGLTKYGSAVSRQFEMQGIFTTAPSIAISRSRDKLRATQIMARAGVGIPKTAFARETAEINDLIEQIGGAPLIIKVARGTHGNGVVLAETRKAAQAVMKRQSLDDDFRSNLHQGGEGVPIKLTDQEKKTAQKAAKAMGLPICGVDMMRSKNGPLVLEVNASPGFGIEKVTNHNVAEKIIEYVEQNAKGRRRKDKVGA